MPWNIYLELNTLENVCAIVNVALSVPLKPLESSYFSVMKTSTILEAVPCQVLVKTRLGRRVGQPKCACTHLQNPLERDQVTVLPLSLGRWELGVSVLKRKGKGNTVISSSKFQLSPSLEKMVWDELKLPFKVHTAL